MKKQSQKLARLVVQLLLIILFANNAYSQWPTKIFKKVKSVVTTAGKAAVKVTAAPYQTTYNTIKVVSGKASPKTIYQPYTDISKTVGSGIPNTVDLLNMPKDFAYQQALKFSANFGSTGKFIFDISTFADQLSDQFRIGNINAMGNVLKGQNPLQIGTTLAAAAIRAARERHLAEARPLPSNIREALRNYFPASTLNRAKYCKGDIQITLTNFLNKSVKLFYNHENAATVDDIIVFSVTPPVEPKSLEEWKWWVHELTHVRQYEQLGVEKFAFNYTKDWGTSIENEANAHAATFRLYIPANLSTIEINNSMSEANIAKSTAPSETYIYQCFLWDDKSNVTYFVTAEKKIMKVDPVSGESEQIGWCTPPLDNVATWTFQTSSFRYAVTLQGQIFDFRSQLMPNGFWSVQPVQIGHIVKL